MPHKTSLQIVKFCLTYPPIDHSSPMWNGYMGEYNLTEDIISWREARSSTGRLVTGWAGMGSAAQKTKLSITRSIFELEAQNFACK